MAGAASRSMLHSFGVNTCGTDRRSAFIVGVPQAGMSLEAGCHETPSANRWWRDQEAKGKPQGVANVLYNPCISLKVNAIVEPMATARRNRQAPFRMSWNGCFRVARPISFCAVVALVAVCPERAWVICRSASARRLAMGLSHSNADGRAGNPSGADLDRRRSRAYVGRYAKVHLIAVDGAGGPD
jgi:hypothetical protein